MVSPACPNTSLECNPPCQPPAQCPPLAYVPGIVFPPLIVKSSDPKIVRQDAPRRHLRGTLIPAASPPTPCLSSLPWDAAAGRVSGRYSWLKKTLTFVFC